MRSTTSGPDNGAMHHTNYTTPTSPRGLASLTDRQRSERAAWRASIRQARPANRRWSLFTRNG